MNALLQEIISGKITAYNLHSHTQFCDGRATMQEMVEAAIKSGMTHYGFSPHSPIPFTTSCNMALTSVKPYLEEVNRLRSLYGEQINLYTSLEIDYLGPDWGASSPYFTQLPLDYTISSIHFIKGLDGNFTDIDGKPERFVEKMSQCFDGDIRYVVDEFYRQSLQMIEQGGFDILGHWDKIGHNASYYQPGIEDQDWYLRHIETMIEAIKASGVVIEINTKAWQVAHRMFPNTRYWRRLKSAAIPMVINSDAHFPDRIDSGLEAARQMLEEIEDA